MSERFNPELPTTTHKPQEAKPQGKESSLGGLAEVFKQFGQNHELVQQVEFTARSGRLQVGDTLQELLNDTPQERETKSLVKKVLDISRNPVSHFPVLLYFAKYSQDADVRWTVAWIVQKNIAEGNNMAGIEEILLGDQDADVRIEVALGFENYIKKHRDTLIDLNRLKPLVNDPDPEVRLVAVRTLLQTSWVSKAHLKPLINDPDPEIRSEILKRLKALSRDPVLGKTYSEQYKDEISHLSFKEKQQAIN